MSIDLEFVRDTFRLVVDEISDEVMTAAFHEIDSMVQLAKGREEEALKDLDDPEFVAKHNIHPVIGAMVKALIKNRIEVDKARAECCFSIYEAPEGYHFEWYTKSNVTCDSESELSLEEDSGVSERNFDTIEEALEYIEKLKHEEPEFSRWLDGEVEDFFRDYEYLWDPKWYCND